MGPWPSLTCPWTAESSLTYPYLAQARGSCSKRANRRQVPLGGYSGLSGLTLQSTHALTARALVWINRSCDIIAVHRNYLALSNFDQIN